ncbi:MFS transporter [Micromonospora chokoriensis]
MTEISEKRKWWAVGVLSVAVLITGLDITVLNLAMPQLATDIGASTADLQWIINSYVLAEAALLLPIGLMADRWGRKKILIGALVLFGVTSLFAANAETSAQLIIARTILGLGAAALVPIPFALVRVMFREDERTKAFAVLSGITMLSLPLGPLLGGWLVSHFWWGSVFLINVPVVAFTVVALIVLLPESRASQTPRVDLTGIVVSSLGLILLTFGIIEAGRLSITDPVALGSSALGVVILAGFIFRERALTRRPGAAPLLDMSLFRSRPFTWGTILSVVVFFAISGLLFTLPQYFQEVRNNDPMETGVRLLPVILGIAIGVIAYNWILNRFGATVGIGLGFFLIAVGMAAAAGTTLSSGYGYVFGWSVIIGAGLGFVMVGTAAVAMNEISEERSGVGTAMMQAVQRFASALGVAILGAIFNANYRGSLELPGLPAETVEAARDSAPAGVEVARQLGSEEVLTMVRSAFMDGMSVMLWAMCGIAIAGLLLTVVMLPPRVLATAKTDNAEADGSSDQDALAGYNGS